jgi:hypothetical protein
LPTGVIYFEIDRDPSYWKDVARTFMLGLRFKLDWGRFLNPRMIAMTMPKTQKIVNLQFAVFVVKPA